ncbi:hypothetical protein BN1263440146 [Stenotrophomonas indicatrix]|nr:hypothetical protein BN1263440146 [Stenotrophomonas indicatrix]
MGRDGPAGPLAPWMAPSSPHGWVHGVSRWPIPTRPASSNPEPLLTLLLPLLLPAAGSARGRRRKENP